MTKTKNYEMDMCSGSLLKKMLVYALPIMFSGVLQLLFNAADIVVVGRFAGDNSLAAVGSTSSVIQLLTNLFIGLSVGANVLVAQYYGAKDEQSLQDTIHTSMLLSFLCGIILTILGVATARPILKMMQAPPEVLEKAIIYMRIYFLGMTATMVYDFGSAIMRAVGDTQRPLYFLLLAGVVNVILNLFFVIVLHMDVAGVALATSISQTISAVLVVRCLLKNRGALQLHLKKLRVKKYVFTRILQIGLPSGATGVVFSLSNVVIQSAINSFGEIVIAGNSAAYNIEGFVFTAVNGFYQAVISFTSQNFGAQKIRRIPRILGVGILYSALFSILLTAIALGFGRQLLGIYTENPEVIQEGYYRMCILLGTFVIASSMDVFSGGLRGMGYSMGPMIISLVGVCGVRLVWIATVFQMERFHTLLCLYACYPITWVITTTAMGLCFLWVYKKVRCQTNVQDSMT